ncbi:MAG: cold shock domain-containing protein, partial [Anaerolineae bacterium]|nr:cold shock domain-containing protein [Anaerolineae bacterium]
WAEGAPPLGATGLPVGQGIVRWFDFGSGNGVIVRDGSNEELFFNFTAIPGQGYRTVSPGTPVKFEIVEHASGLIARNIQVVT